MIKSIPSVWDETIVLPPSEIGELAAFARRSGDRSVPRDPQWPGGQDAPPAPPFLEAGNHRTLMVRDRDDDPAAVRLEEATVTKDDAIDVRLRAGGGFIARFDRGPVTSQPVARSGGGSSVAGSPAAKNLNKLTKNLNDIRGDTGLLLQR